MDGQPPFKFWKQRLKRDDQAYSPEIADAICEEIATTDHAQQRICEREGMPDPGVLCVSSALNITAEHGRSWSLVAHAVEIVGIKNLQFV